MAHNPKIAPICFILAPAYHGAMTLAQQANQHPHILSLGTANPLRQQEQICSCGEDCRNFCAFWTKAKTVVDQDKDYADSPFPTLLPPMPYLVSNAVLNRWLNGAISLAANEIGSRCWKMVYEPAERFFGAHDRFLTFAQDWYPHKVFLDAERSSLKFMAMASMDLPVKGVIHLVRDPRGYAAAWKKYYPESTAEKLGLEWAAAHTRLRRLAQCFPRIPFLRIKYEDLVQNTDQVVEKAINFMRLKPAAPGEGGLDPRKNHLIGPLSADTSGPESWRETLSPEDQNRVIRAAGPLFSELGYKN